MLALTDSCSLASQSTHGGIDPAREIVVYSTRGHAGANFAHFAIRYFGSQNVSVYHDGIDGWADDKRPLETSETRLAPVPLKLAPNSALPSPRRREFGR